MYPLHRFAKSPEIPGGSTRGLLRSERGRAREIEREGERERFGGRERERERERKKLSGREIASRETRTT
jgi:hypothetical protein